MIPRDLPQSHVHRLNGIRGVNHLANLLRVTEQRNHMTPMGAPDLADGRIRLVPFLGKELQIELSLSLGCRRVDGL